MKPTIQAIGLVSISGGGRGTLLKMIHEHFPQSIQIPGHTTRAMREGEINGIHKHFVSQETFLNMKNNNEFLETSHHYDTWYGTAKQSYADSTQQGHFGVFDIEYVGALEIKNTLGDQVRFIFIDVEGNSVEEKKVLIEKRLIDRGTESFEKIQKRVDRLPDELRYAHSFDYYIINKQNHIDDCYLQIASILEQCGIFPAGK